MAFGAYGSAPLISPLYGLTATSYNSPDFSALGLNAMGQNTLYDPYAQSAQGGYGELNQVLFQFVKNMLNGLESSLLNQTSSQGACQCAQCRGGGVPSFPQPPCVPSASNMYGNPYGTGFTGGTGYPPSYGGYPPTPSGGGYVPPYIPPSEPEKSGSSFWKKVLIGSAIGIGTGLFATKAKIFGAAKGPDGQAVGGKRTLAQVIGGWFHKPTVNTAKPATAPVTTGATNNATNAVNAVNTTIVTSTAAQLTPAQQKLEEAVQKHLGGMYDYYKVADPSVLERSRNVIKALSTVPLF